MACWRGAAVLHWRRRDGRWVLGVGLVVLGENVSWAGAGCNWQNDLRAGGCLAKGMLE